MSQATKSTGTKKARTPNEFANLFMGGELKCRESHTEEEGHFRWVFHEKKLLMSFPETLCVRVIQPYGEAPKYQKVVISNFPSEFESTLLKLENYLKHKLVRDAAMSWEVDPEHIAVDPALSKSADSGDTELVAKVRSNRVFKSADNQETFTPLTLGQKKMSCVLTIAGFYISETRAGISFRIDEAVILQNFGDVLPMEANPAQSLGRPDRKSFFSGSSKRRSSAQSATALKSSVTKKPKLKRMKTDSVIKEEEVVTEMEEGSVDVAETQEIDLA